MSHKIIKIDKNRKEDNKVKKNKTGEPNEFMSVCIELEKSDTYLLSVEVPIADNNRRNNDKINTQAITMGWEAINNKLVDLSKARIGGSFSQKVLKRTKIDKSGNKIK